MKVKNLTERENRLAHTHGVHLVGGLDEVGRGAIAGPLVVGCVVRDISLPFPHVADSKVLSFNDRASIVPLILDSAKAWSVGIVEALEIDEYGMAWALPVAFQRAYDALAKKPDLTMYDGRHMHLQAGRPMNIIKGDSTHASIAAASIVAKVIRDLMMIALHEDFGAYGFADHKGYGSKEHFAAVAAHGLLAGIHRKGFIHRQESLL